MKEKFEHKLVNRIKDIFDSHEADYNLQDWELMKDKLPAKRSIVPLIWIVGRAAVILALVALGSWFLWNGLFNEESQIIKEETFVESNYGETENNNHNQKSIIDSSNYIIQEYLSEESKIVEPIKENDKLIDKKSQTLSLRVAEVNNSAEEQTSKLNVIDDSDLDSVVIPTPVSETIVADNSSLNMDSIVQTNTIISQPTVAQLEPIPEIFENEKTKKQRVRLGAEFVSFTNYSPENVSPGLNYGGGITADIPIKKRFSFNPGLVVSVYNVEFADNQTTLDAGQPNAFSVNSLIASSTEIKPSKMHLTSLDIPVNFQYQFLQRKTSDYFVEVGFSSLVYLSENFQYTFVSSSGGPFPHDTESSGNNSASGEVNVDAFNTFDFAKLINFSVGMDYRLNKRLDFTINPYIKYPVSTLTSGDIKFGSGGLKLKFMLKPGK